MWDGVRKAFHILIHDCFFLISCVLTSGPPLEKKELGLVSVSPSVSVALVSTLASVSPLLSLLRWSPHLPQCLSTSVSVALVSTLATMSVHFCLCRVGLHICHSVSPLLSFCRLGLHTCHSVCPQRPQVSQSLSVRLSR